MTLTIIDPTVSSTRQGTAAAARADRRPTLAGARVGLLENTKRNAVEVLDAIGAALEAEHGAGTLVRRTKRPFALPLTPELVEDLRRECDVVVIGVGDCGSCSAAAVADGIALERVGLPTAVVCTDAFEATSHAMAELKGDPDFPYLLTAHPVANLDEAGIAQRARELVAPIAARLTSPEA